MFPLSTVLFPGALLPLHVFEERYRIMIRGCMAGTGNFGVVLIERGSEVGGGDVRLERGTVAHIEELRELGDGRYALLARGMGRVDICRWLVDDPYPMAEIRELGLGEAQSARAAGQAAAAVSRARALLSELGETPGVTVAGWRFTSRPAAPDAAAAQEGGAQGPLSPDLGWQICDAAPLGELDRYRLLSIDDADERLSTLVELCGDVADDTRRLLGGR